MNTSFFLQSQSASFYSLDNSVTSFAKTEIIKHGCESTQIQKSLETRAWPLENPSTWCSIH
jgi:hypothetical protein